jgi:hypothetical protein
MSKLVVSTLESPAASGIITVAPGDIVYSPGSVIQVIQNHTYSVSATSFPASYTTFTNIPELTASITPKSASSKILIEVRWFGEFNAVGVTWDSVWNIKRGTTLIGRDTWLTDRHSGLTVSSLSYYAGDASSTPESAYFTYLDSPNTTSTITYNGCFTSNQGGTIYTNRTVAYTAGGHEAGTSSVTLWEIAQ